MNRLRIWGILLRLTLIGALVGMTVTRIQSLFSGEHESVSAALTDAFIALACILGVVLVIAAQYIMPFFLQNIAEKIRQFIMGESSAYNPKTDELIQLVSYISQTSDRERLPRLEQLCEAQGKRLRGWSEYIRLLTHSLKDTAEALRVSEKAVEHLSSPQDKALILYRAGRICEGNAAFTHRALSYYQQAAQRFPRTTYGKMAAEKL